MFWVCLIIFIFHSLSLLFRSSLENRGAAAFKNTLAHVIGTLKGLQLADKPTIKLLEKHHSEATGNYADDSILLEDIGFAIDRLRPQNRV